MKTMGNDHMTSSGTELRSNAAGRRFLEDNTDWQQQQLLPEAKPGNAGAGRSAERRRKAGLVGIAQAREALAEAINRAKAQAESMAA